MRKVRRKKIIPRLCSLGSTVWEQEKHFSNTKAHTPWHSHRGSESGPASSHLIPQPLIWRWSDPLDQASGSKRTEAGGQLIHELNRAIEAAQIAWITRRELSVWRAIHANCASWKIWTLADIRAALTNQELALAVTSLRAEATIEDKLIVVVCGYPELYDTTSYFYKNRNKFSNETGAAWQKPLPWRVFASVV